MPTCLFRPLSDGLALALRVSPNAARERIEGIAADADGNPFLKVAVTVPPENGKANAAAIKLLAKEFGVAKSTLSIASGAAARRKVVHIAGDARALEAKLMHWLKLHNAA